MKLADLFKRSDDTEANVASLTEQLAALQTQAGELDTVNKTLTSRVAELESKLAAANTATTEAQTEAEKAKAQADAAAAKASADKEAAVAAQAAADKKNFDDAVNARAAELAAAQGASAPLPAGKASNGNDELAAVKALTGLAKVTALFKLQSQTK